MNDLFSKLNSDYNKFKVIQEANLTKSNGTSSKKTQGREWVKLPNPEVSMGIPLVNVEKQVLEPSSLASRVITLSNEEDETLEKLFLKAFNLKTQINHAATPEEKNSAELEFEKTAIKISYQQMMALDKLILDGSRDKDVLALYKNSLENYNALVDKYLSDNESNPDYVQLGFELIELNHLTEDQTIEVIEKLLNTFSNKVKERVFEGLQNLFKDENQREKLIFHLCILEPPLAEIALKTFKFDSQESYIKLFEHILSLPKVRLAQLETFLDKVTDPYKRVDLLLKYAQEGAFSIGMIEYALKHEQSMTEIQKAKFCKLLTINDIVGNYFLASDVEKLIRKWQLDKGDLPIKLALELAPYSLRDAIDVLTTYKISDPDIFYQFLQRAASSEDLSKYFKEIYDRCNISNDPDKKFSLAQSLAQQRSNIELLKELDLTPEKFQELLPVCAKTSAIHTITTFNITDPEKVYGMCKWSSYHDPEDIEVALKDNPSLFLDLLSRQLITSEQLFEIIGRTVQDKPKIYEELPQLPLSEDQQVKVVELFTKNLVLGFLKNGEFENLNVQSPAYLFGNSKLVSPLQALEAMLKVAATNPKINLNMKASEVLFALDDLDKSVQAIKDVAVPSENASVVIKRPPIIPEIVQFLDKAMAMSNLMERYTNQTWISTLVAAIKAYNISEEQQKEYLPVLQSLMDYRNPLLRRQMTAHLLEHIIGTHSGPLAMPPSPSEELKVPRMLLAPLGFDSPGVQKLMIAFKADPRFLKDARKVHILNHALMTLVSDPFLNKTEKNQILEALLSKTDKPTLPDVRSFQAIGDLIELEQYDRLKNIKSFSDINKQFETLFQEEFGVSRENFHQKYEASIGKWREPNSIFTYLSRLKKLPIYEQSVISTYKTFITDVLNQTSVQSRYEKNDRGGLHLQTVFQDQPELEKTWKTGISFNDLLGNKTVPVGDIITTGILAGELGDSELNRIIELAKSKDPAQINANAAILNSRINAKVAALKTSSPDQKKQLNQELFKLRLEKTLLDNLTKELDPTKEKDRSVIAELSKIFKNRPTEAKLQEAMKVKSEFTMQLSDDPNDLMLMGTEIENSCQIVSGDPRLNKCLMGYAVDGKNKILVIKDDNGKMVGRVVLRLLLDEKKQPVLFRERIYVNNLGNRDELDRLLAKGCTKFAEALKIPLVTVELDPMEKGSPSNIVVESLGSPAPAEYKDAIGSDNLDPVYSIKDSYLLYRPIGNSTIK